MFTELRTKLSLMQGRTRALHAGFRECQDVDTSADSSFCLTLLEHTVSAECIPFHLTRTPSTSLTWHNSLSQRAAGGPLVKLLQQPGTEVPQSQLYSDHCGLYYMSSSLGA